MVHLNGAMELAPSLGLARVIVDLVQTGSTLKANGLIETEVIAKVTSRLIVNRTALKTMPEVIGGWIARFRAALAAMTRLDTRDPGFEAGFAALLDMARETTAKVDAVVADILAAVRAGGDAALLDLTARFDRWTPADAAALRVTAAEIDAATAGIPAGLLAALDLAAERIERFHAAQRPADLHLPDPAGLTLGMRWTALDAVGIYVPGGKAAYPSSVLMNALPARVAGVGRIAMVVPTPTGTSTRWCWRRRGGPG